MLCVINKLVLNKKKKSASKSNQKYKVFWKFSATYSFQHEAEEGFFWFLRAVSLTLIAQISEHLRKLL